MKAGIYTNLIKDAGLEVTSSLVALLKSHRQEFFVYKNVAKDFPKEKIFDENDYTKLDVIITVGGDGTVLNIAKDCVKGNIPLLPVNRGTKGFLNEIELENLDAVIEVLGGNFKIDKRILISVEAGGKEYYALNDAYITRKSTGKMISLSAYVGGEFADEYYCDGLLVCTPTGSTAYSLSAGGPIISPNASVMCLTPVCSHSLHSRPIVIGDDEQIELTLDMDYDDCVLMIDGGEVGLVSALQNVKIKKADKTLSFLRLKGSSFYLKLLDKLNGLV